MRKILFRGQRIDNGEWVEGFYCYNPFMKRAEIFAFDEIRSYVYQVIPETVGQFTGLRDGKGQMIFEGDIFICTKFPKHKYIVEWDDETASFNCFNDAIGFNHTEIEIVGNIHEKRKRA